MERERHVVVDVAAGAVGVPTVVDGEGVEERRPIAPGRRGRSRRPTRSSPICTSRRKNCQLFCAGSRRSMPRSHSTTWSRCVPVSGSHRCSGTNASANPMAAISTMRWSTSSVHGPQYSALVGIGAVREALDPPVPVVEGAAARDQRHDAPERARVPLELGDPRCEVRAERAEPGPGAAGGEVRDDRLHEIDHRPLHVGLGGERVARHRVGPRVLQRLHHAIRSRSSARTSCSSASPATKRRISATARSPMRESSVPSEPAMCGVRTTFGRS